MLATYSRLTYDNKRYLEEMSDEMNNKLKTFDSRIDYGIILPVFILSLVGLLSLYVSLVNDPLNPNVLTLMLKQMLWLLLGAVAIIVVMQFSSKMLWKATPYFYGFGLFIMTILLKFYDKNLYNSTGSKNWFNLGPLSFQPSELMKIAFILMLAYIVTKHNSENSHTLKNDGILIGKLFLVTVPVAILLKLQQDLGTMLVFVAILGGVFLMSGISWRIIVPTVIVFIALGSGIIYLMLSENGRQFLYDVVGVKQYQFARIDSWLDPFHDTAGKSMQQAQALIAIGSGGLFGKGFNVSEVYVPVRESDMIFTVIAENFGFIGSVFVIFTYFILIYQMIRVCFDTNNEFYAYIATGIIMMILFHVFENIGANIGLLPLTGIPLPFISQGGSSLLGNMIGIGLMLSMRFQQDDYIKLQR